MSRYGNSKLQNITRGLVIAALAAFTLPSSSAAQRYITSAGEDPEYWRIQYADSLYSLNDQCIVRLRKLSLRIPPVYVNGLPIGFC